MAADIDILLITAASIGFIHTLTGPDHYLPFIVMSKARKWTTLKTVTITVLCGLGHVGSSVVIGAIGLLLGIGLHKLNAVESVRGDWAAWGFLVFGLGYLLWALWKLKSGKPHVHAHVHAHDHEHQVHIHPHGHIHASGLTLATPHTHEHAEKPANLTPWILFLVFVLGPCEPLIPILMYPAAQASVLGLVAVTGVFALTTITTMVAIVLAVNYGVSFIKVGKLEKYTHVIAGATLALSGALILLGL